MVSVSWRSSSSLRKFLRQRGLRQWLLSLRPAAHDLLRCSKNVHTATSSNMQHHHQNAIAVALGLEMQCSVPNILA